MQNSYCSIATVCLCEIYKASYQKGMLGKRFLYEGRLLFIHTHTHTHTNPRDASALV